MDLKSETSMTMNTDGVTDGGGGVVRCVCETTMIQATFFMRRLLLLNRIRRRQLALPNNFACTISPFF